MDLLIQKLQARRLVEAVQGNKNPEYIHEIVCVDDLLFAVQKIEFRNKIEDDTPESLALDFITCKDSMINKLNSCTPINLAVLRDIKHAARQAIKKTLEIAENYNENIQTAPMKISYGIIRHSVEMDASIRVKSNLQVSKGLSCHWCIGVSIVCSEMENLVQLLKIKIEDEQVANNLHNLVILAFVNEIATPEQLIRIIEFAKVHDV